MALQTPKNASDPRQKSPATGANIGGASGGSSEVDGDEITPHEELRQEILSQEPEGREPTPRVRRLSWITFGAVLFVGVPGLLFFLWYLGGWSAAIIGFVLTLGGYLFAYGAEYIAIAFRVKDRHDADDKASAIEGRSGR